MRRRRRSRSIFALGLFGTGLVSAAVSASVIRVVALSEMIERAAFVFDGVARASRVVPSQPHGLPETCVSFAVIEAIKGDPGSQLTLCFAGGPEGDLEYRISGLEIPRIGDRGVFFVAPDHAGRAHPLVGWSQGRLRIESRAADGEPRVYTEDGRAVIGLEPTVDGRHRSRWSDGAADGLLTSPEPDDALPAGDFKLRLRRTMGEAQR